MRIFFNNMYTGASLVGLPIAFSIATTTAIQSRLLGTA
jgi:hypothetical protein